MDKGLRTQEKARQQFGAVPLRTAADGSLEILLITTRTTGRWTIPKGWPIKGLKAHEAAAREALEEAGAVGTIDRTPVGRYLYWKRMDGYFQLCEVEAYLLKVESQLDDWPERDQRRHEWFKLKDAADLVEEPGLKAVLRSLDST